MTSTILFNFDTTANISSWTITNDVVMGGKTASTFTLNTDGHGMFSGHVSLENNGGFASVRYQFPKIAVTPKTKIKIRLKGDGKDYKFRVKHTQENYYSYNMQFTTSGVWQEVIIPLKDLYPVFRGKKLNEPNFDHNEIAQIVFLIGNKKNEDFALLIDYIEVV